jgi:hypothetical protein
MVTVQTNPVAPTRREPNCKPGDPVDARGLVHAWKNIGWVEEPKTDAVYVCDRCGATDVD